MGKRLRRKHVDAALRHLISDLDYDLHKNLESDEDTGEDVYGVYVSQFIREYKQSAAKAEKSRRRAAQADQPAQPTLRVRHLTRDSHGSLVDSPEGRS